MGSRQRRVTGDQFDNFSVDFVFEDGRHFHSMCRQINGCAQNVSERLQGAKGSTNCQNLIHDLAGTEIWKYAYPLDEEGKEDRKCNEACNGSGACGLCYINTEQSGLQ